MADRPTNRTHILKSRMLSRSDLMILCGTGTDGKAGGNDDKDSGVRAVCTAPSYCPGARS